MAAKVGRRTSKDEASSALADLFAALDDGSLTAVQQILERPELTVNSTNKHGESPLHVASGSGHLELVRWLNENGAFIDVKDKVSRCV
jgi:ankyrin repeat protein